MRKHRKCDTTKYKKRRAKEKVAHSIRVERKKKEEMVRGRILYEQRERIRIEREQKRPLVQTMVNLLAKNVCERDNRYYGALNVRELLMISSIMDINPRPQFPYLPEPPRESLIEDDRVIEGEIIR